MSTSPQTRAVVFDAMGTLFDLAPLRERFCALGAPPIALEAWFERLLHTAATLTFVGEFRPFREIAESTIEPALVSLDVDPARKSEVLDGLEELEPYPDAGAALDLLDGAGVRAIVLTNGGAGSTRKLLEKAGLLERFELILATEHAQAYKPSPAPYRLALERLALPGEQVTLIAAHGWDVVGARAAGLEAIWVERLERRWPFPLPPVDGAADLEAAARRAIGREPAV